MSVESCSSADSGSATAVATPEPEVILSIGSPKTVSQEKCLATISSVQQTPFTIGPCSATFTTPKRKGRYILSTENTLKNSLLMSVGYLELANAGDFAANVWNDVPPPKFAIVLMAIGGTLALSIPYFAFKDACSSWANIRLLRRERIRIRATSKKGSSDEETQLSISEQHSQRVLLDITRRELGSEIVDRLGMEILMGCGALLVGVGTLMAIGGADPEVFIASNLLSGYVGNSWAASYSIVNAAWSIFIWIRAHRHGRAASRFLPVDVNNSLVQPRLGSIQMHSIINGATGLIAGAASLLTATLWWGYVVLAPCIISMIWCNYYWRHTIGYDRPIIQHLPNPLNWAEIVGELGFIEHTRIILTDEALQLPSSDLPTAILGLRSLPSIIDFIVRNDLFEEFSRRILQDESLASSLIVISDGNSAVITSDAILAANEEQARQVTEIAHTCIRVAGPRHLVYRQRYLLDILGSALCHESNS